MPNPSRRRPRTHRPQLPLLRTPQQRNRTPHQLDPRRPRTPRMTIAIARLAALPRTHAGGHRPNQAQRGERMAATKRLAASPRARGMHPHHPSEPTNRTFGTVTACARGTRLPASPRAREVNVLFDHRAREERTQPCQTASETLSHPTNLTTSHSTTPTVAMDGWAKTSKADQSPASNAGRTSPTPPRSTASGDLSAQARAHPHEVTG